MASDLPSELETRKAQRDILAAFLREHPNRDLWKEDLIAVIGDNYRSRISDCRDELHMYIPNVPRYRVWTDERGKTRRQRLIGGYRYVPAASEPSPDRWSIPGAPFAERPWTLTAPESR